MMSSFEETFQRVFVFLLKKFNVELNVLLLAKRLGDLILKFLFLNRTNDWSF